MHVDVDGLGMFLGMLFSEAGWTFQVEFAVRVLTG